MSQHTKIKKGSVTIANAANTGTTTIDMEVSTEDMRRLEDDYGLSSGDWYKRLIPTIIKTGLAGAAGGALEKPQVAITVPDPVLHPSQVQIVLTVSTNVIGGYNATYDVWLEYPHSIIR